MDAEEGWQMAVDVWQPDTAVHTEADASIAGTAAVTTHATGSPVSTVSVRVVSVVERFRQVRNSVMHGREFTEDSTEVIRRMRDDRTADQWHKPS
jgi:hypothetical protein